MNFNKSLRLILIVSLIVFSSLPTLAMTVQQKKMIDQLDQLDHLDFIEEYEKANVCIQTRDFACAEKKIAKAAKYVVTSKDKQSLRLIKQSLAEERKAVQEELAETARIEQQLQIELAEAARIERQAQAEQERQIQAEQQRVQAEQEQQARESRAQSSSGSGFGDFIRAAATVGAGAYAGYATRGYSAEQQTRVMDSAMRSVYNNDASAMQATTDQVIAERRQEQKVKLEEIRAQKARDEQAAQDRKNRALEQAAANRRAQQEERNRQALQAAQEQQAKKTQAKQAQAEVTAENQEKKRQEAKAQLAAKQRTQQKQEEELQRKVNQQAKNQPQRDKLTRKIATGYDSPEAGGTKREPVKEKNAETKKKKVIYGPEQIEAIAICWQGKRNKDHWRCDGPGQDTILSDDTLEKQLGYAGCSKPRSSDGMRTITRKDGSGGEARVFLCGYGIWTEVDIAKKYGFTVQRNKYQCTGSTYPTSHCTDNFQLEH